MKLFALKAKVPKATVQRVARQLMDNARLLGICPTNHNRVSDDPEDSDETPVIAFICSAEASLDPQQVITLMTICVMAKATILGITYTDVDAEDEEGHSGTVHFLPAPSPPPPQARGGQH